MPNSNLSVLADSAVKAAGLGNRFDPTNVEHARYVQKFARAAQETCVATWHQSSPVRKIASRTNVHEAYSTLAALEKWASVAEKTAAFSASTR